MRCDACKNWLLARKTCYEDGSEVVNFQAPEGKGHCETLNIDTAPEFGCASYADAAGYDHVEVSQKSGAPWQHSYAGTCPDCGGKGCVGDGMAGAGCHRCAGTGKVRHYDDGFIGDERTRLHPKERQMPPTCAGCSATLQPDWVACPKCGKKREWPAKIEAVSENDSMHVR